MYTWIVILIAGLSLFSAPSSAAKEKRVALVIGNSSYTVAPLRNPRNDATDVANLLEKQLGFETNLLLDADQASMQRAIRDFSLSIKEADVRLFYYAGHGVSVDGVNFMIPVNAEIKNEEEVQWEAVDTSLVLNSMEKFNTGANVLILDACRDNPLPKSTRSNHRGLDKMKAPLGSMILYATAPGQVALDGAGRNGTFTKHLLRSLAAPNVHIGDIALDVRVAVMQDTNNQQVPWSESSLTRRIYLSGQNQDSVSTAMLDSGVEASTSIQTDIDQSVSVFNDENNTSAMEFSNTGDYDSSILTAYLDAATAGDAIAQASLGYIYDVGRTVAQDNAKARIWYEKAAEQNQLDAMVNLGIMYLTGDGGTQDREKAVSLLRDAAEAGHPAAQRNLGTLYQFGDAVQTNYDIAHKWFEKAADQGYIDAYVDLGDLYSRGIGVQKNDQIAFEWYLKAARQGSATAQSEVGFYYDQGLGGEKNYDQAFSWFSKAAEQNDPTGIYNLAEMHELGKGTPIDLDRARNLYEKALLLGDELAAEALIRFKNDQ